MAEARSAVSVSLDPGFNEKHHEIEECNSWQHTYTFWMRDFKRRYYRTRNLIRNGLWPTSLWNLCVSVLLLTCLQLFPFNLTAPVASLLSSLMEQLPLPKQSPALVKVVISSFICGLVFFIILLYVRRYLLRALLAYRGWMYEPPRQQSSLTLIWGALVHLATGSHPTLHSYQRSLPRLSVPPLKETIDKLLTSLKPLYLEHPEEFSQLRREALEFERTLGPKLQKALVLKSWLSPNYVSDWWQEYVYLMGRSPLPINSNYYIMDQCKWSPTHSNASRGATTLYNVLMVKQKLERETMEPLVIRNTIPLCMAQYDHIFSTTRIPGEETDRLVCYDMMDSKHVVVHRKGILYKLDVYDSHRRIVAPQILEKQLKWILDDAEKHQDECTEGQKSIPVLTCLDRTSWWQIRNQYFKTGVNKESLHLVESAVCFVNLDSHSFSDGALSERATYLLHGDGRCVWFDKSLTLLIFEDGKMGLNCEHSFADAPVVAHTIEYNLLQEVLGIQYENGHLLPVTTASTFCTLPERLVWEVDFALEAHISRALKFHQQNIDDLDLVVADHDNFGKGFIKTCKVSPDAFIQMALQVTYLKNSGRLALTYEAAMTRLYLEGRTETVRSLTLEAAAFAQAFLNDNVTSAEKRKLLIKACERHQIMYKDAMNGKGIDRHLFTLYVASRGLGYECEFLKKVLSIPWTLSTSQQPQQQIASAPDCSSPEYHDKLSPGGGFGPVSDDGYGVSYMVPGDRRIFFHVSSKRSNSATSSKKFMKQLFETLSEMKCLFEQQEQ